MNRSLVERVEALEHDMAVMKISQPMQPEASGKGWMSTFGMFANDTLFDDAMDAGEAWRKTQTWDKEGVEADRAGS